MINLESGFAFEADGLAGAQESLDLLQAQFLCFVHVDGQSSACHPLQAHLVLESHLPFRLISHWIRLVVKKPQSLWYSPSDLQLRVKGRAYDHFVAPHELKR